MQDLDLSYLCTVIGNLSGVPIRCYRGQELIFYHSLVRLPRDPMAVYRQDIWSIESHIGYYVTPHFNYYGIVNSGSTKLIIGPTRQTENSAQELRELAFRADVPAEEIGDFVAAMKSIVRMPLESILQMLCTMNYILNGEKLSLQDIGSFDSHQDTLRKIVARQAIPDYSPETGHGVNVHNTYQLEQTILGIIRKGDTAALEQWLKDAPAVRGGVLAKEQLRQMKNTFIVTATLASRAAIRGGMDIDEAFTLSDAFIQHCELLHAPEQLWNLQYHMILEYTQRVQRILHGRHPGKLALEVSGYIRRHLSESITVEDIAKELYLSRPYLSRKFTQETGQSLTDFILKEKTEEAKRLLRYSDKPLSAISSYLGFSSQSHFSRVFKKYANCTPGEYRAKYTL